MVDVLFQTFNCSSTLSVLDAPGRSWAYLDAPGRWTTNGPSKDTVDASFEVSGPSFEISKSVMDNNGGQVV